MPWFGYFQLCQSWIKGQVVAAKVISSKAIGHAAKRMFQDLGIKFWELLRVTSGKRQCWEAPESNCRCCHRAWGKAAVSCDTVLIARSNDYIVRLSSATSTFSSKGLKTFHTASVIKLLKCHGFGNGGAMLWRICCLGSFLPAPQYSGIQFYQITQSKSIYRMKVKSLCPGSWSQYFCVPLSGISWVSNLFSWRVEGIAMVPNENVVEAQHQHKLTQWIASSIEMTSLSIVAQEALWDSNLVW